MRDDDGEDEDEDDSPFGVALTVFVYVSFYQPFLRNKYTHL